MKGKPLFVGLAAGLTIALCTDAGMAWFSDTIGDNFFAQLSIAHVVLSLFGGFFVGGAIAGIVQRKDAKIELGSGYSLVLIAVGTWITYMLLGRFFF